MSIEVLRTELIDLSIFGELIFVLLMLENFFS